MRPSSAAFVLLALFVAATSAQWSGRTNEFSWMEVIPVSRVRFGNGSHWVERVMLTGFERCSDDRFGGELQARYPLIFQNGDTRYCQIGPPVYDTSNTVTPDMTAATHQMPNMPYIDLNRLAPRGRGTPRVLVTHGDTPDPPRAAPNGGDFRITCGFSHFAFDDPLVYPNRRGASHLHMFFGNTLTSAFSTRESIMNSGNSTCAGGILNRSAYWVPAMLDSTGKAVVPHSAIWYYKSAFIDAGLMRPVPGGLSMIAGSANATSRETNDADYHYYCESAHGVRRYSIPNCNGTNDILNAFIPFKQCWDGVNLQVSDNKRHMASQRDGACPPSHPYVLPEIALNIRWNIPAGGNTLNWRLSSDTYPTSIPGGYSMHADFMSGWVAETMQTIVDNCYLARRDCHTNLLGNGTALEGVGFGEPAAYPTWAHQALPQDYENQARMVAQPPSQPQSPPPQSQSQSPSPQSQSQPSPGASTSQQPTASNVNSSSVSNVAIMSFVLVALMQVLFVLV